MTYTQEKILFGLGALFSTGVSTIAAAMTTGEARWFFVTLAASVPTALNLALVFKREGEGIRVIIGRANLSILGGVLGSHFVANKFEVISVTTDVVPLAGIAAAVTLGSFLVGYPLLQVINAKSGTLAEKIFKKFTP